LPLIFVSFSSQSSWIKIIGFLFVLVAINGFSLNIEIPV